MATPERAAVDVAEASGLTGMSKKALRRRIERGTLLAVKWGNKRMIPLSELRRQGLLAEGAAPGRGTEESGTVTREPEREMPRAPGAGEEERGIAGAPVGGTEAEEVPPTPAPGKAAAEVLARELRMTAQELEVERLEREHLERERLEQERLERERLELERERLEQERLERERLELERERLERERLELERERLERDRLERERLERERLERERLQRDTESPEVQPRGTEGTGVPRSAAPSEAARPDAMGSPGRGTPAQGVLDAPVAAATPGAVAPETQRPTGAVQPAGGVAPASGLRYYWEEMRAIRVGAVLLLVAVVGLLAWFLLRSDDSPTAQGIHAGGGPVAASRADLANLSSQLGHTLYWAGSVPDTKLEVTLNDTGNVYVRYLTGSTQIGDPSPDFLTVGTYPVIHAFEDLRAYVRNSSAAAKHVPGGGLAVPVPHYPTSVYVAYPQQEFQIEVYDPQPGRALALVRSGGIRPVSGGPA